MRSALVKLRERRGEGIIAATDDETLELGKENQKESEESEESCLLQLLDPFSINKLKRGSCFEVPQPKRKRSLPLEDEFLEEGEKIQRRDRCPSEESNNSIDAELNRHFRPIKRAPVSPPKKNEDGRMVKPTLVRLRPRGRPAKVQSRKTPSVETAMLAPEDLFTTGDSSPNVNLDGNSSTSVILDNQKRIAKASTTCAVSTSSVARPTSARTTSTRSTSASPVNSSASLKCREELTPSTPRLLETPKNYSSSETRLTATSTVY